MKKQTRRSVSISGELYIALKLYCQKYDRAMSNVVESEMRKILELDLKGEATKEVAAKEARTETSNPKDKLFSGSVRDTKRDPGNIFTF